jgi:hypothetical protein
VSAWIVNPEHIAAIVGTATARQPDDMPDTALNLAVALSTENVRSINYRYSDREPWDAALPSEEQVAAWASAPLGRTDFEKAVGCLDYQSCEHPGWESSEARKWLVEVLEASRAWPDEARIHTWGIDDNPETTRSRTDNVY